MRSNISNYLYIATVACLSDDEQIKDQKKLYLAGIITQSKKNSTALLWREREYILKQVEKTPEQLPHLYIVVS